jgi:3-oxoadipate enol-lactonase
MPRAELADVTLFYETAGDGPPVMLIGGTWGDLRQAPGPFAWPGAERFSLLAFDHRDIGRSVSRSSEQPTMADFAGDALGLADHLGWDRFALLGISFGGMVAQEVALLAGARIDRLVLVSTSSGDARSKSYPLHELYELPAGERAGRLAALLDTRATTQPALAEAIESYLVGGPSFAIERAPPAGLLRQLEARRHHDASGRIGALQVPTLVTAGRFDAIAPVAACEALAHAIPGSRLAVLDGGHASLFLMQDPAAWPLIADFLSGAR